MHKTQTSHLKWSYRFRILNWTIYERISNDPFGDLYKCQLYHIQCIWNVPVDLIEVDDASDDL